LLRLLFTALLPLHVVFIYADVVVHVYGVVVFVVVIVVIGVAGVGAVIYC